MMVRIFWLFMLALTIAACNDDQEPEPQQESASEISSSPTPVLEPSPTYAQTTLDNGALAYSVFCIACHGADANGVAGAGPSLITSEFVKAKTDIELMHYVEEGRAANHPDNKSGIAMPPRAGYPNLTDDQILDIIAFLRTKMV